MANEKGPTQKVEQLYRLVFQRGPTADEVKLGLAFVQKASEQHQGANRSKLNPWQQYAQVLMMTNEFVFLE